MIVRGTWGRPLRTVDIGTLQDAFLITAATTIIVIRLQLWATNYPQLGGGGLHIAHLLWGGLCMLVAIGLLLSFVGRARRMPAAIVGGVGFGLFIDELGKFITEDNDYFFKPTATIIYIVFILLYLTTRRMQTHLGFSEPENLANAIDLLSDAAQRGLDTQQRGRALDLLDRAGDGPLVDPLRGLMRATATVPVAPPGRLRRGWEAVVARAAAILERRWVRRALVWAFALWTAWTLLLVVVLVTALGLQLGGAQPPFRPDDLARLTIPNLASLASSTVAAGFVAAGIVRLRRGAPSDGYRLLARAMLIEIFVTQVFIFVESSFSAITGMLVSIVLLVTVRRLESRERALGSAPGATR